MQQSRTRKMLKKSTTKPKTIKNVPWRGWKDVKPTTHGRTVMEKKCGNKCFLGPKKSFPICDMNTCDVDRRGVYAAYVRAREWETRSKRLNRSPSKYRKVSRKAKMLLSNMKKGGLIKIGRTGLPFGKKVNDKSNHLINVHDSNNNIDDFKSEVTRHIEDVFKDENVNNEKKFSNDIDHIIDYYNQYKLDKCDSLDSNKKLIFTFIIQNKISEMGNKLNENDVFKRLLDNVKNIITEIQNYTTKCNNEKMERMANISPEEREKLMSQEEKEEKMQREKEEKEEKERRKSELKVRKPLFSRQRSNSI
jgi:hypothetical protein